MKKTILILSAMFICTVAAIAQDKTEETKSTVNYLPEAKDWSIGIDASPFFRYIGNMFNSNVNNAAPTWNNYTGNPYVLLGKSFKDEKTAYRFVLALTKNNTFDQREVTKAEALPLAPTFFGDSLHRVVDTRKRNSNGGVVIGGGIEKRRGHGRLQGLYGAEMLLSYEGQQHRTYTYGNPLTQNAQGNQPNVNPNDATYTTNWNTVDGDLNNITSGTIGSVTNINSARLLEAKTNGSLGIGLRGFIGAEYFFVPKMSIGGEFGWGMGCVLQGQTTKTWEAEGNLSDGSEAALTITDEQFKNRKREFRINHQQSMGSTVFSGNAMLDYIQPNGTIRLSFYF